MHGPACVAEDACVSKKNKKKAPPGVNKARLQGNLSPVQPRAQNGLHWLQNKQGEERQIFKHFKAELIEHGTKVRNCVHIL